MRGNVLSGWGVFVVAALPCGTRTTAGIIGGGRRADRVPVKGNGQLHPSLEAFAQVVASILVDRHLERRKKRKPNNGDSRSVKTPR